MAYYRGTMSPVYQQVWSHPDRPVTTASISGQSHLTRNERSSTHLELKTMEFVNLGRTGLKVSRICLGCMTYGKAPEGEVQCDLRSFE